MSIRVCGLPTRFQEVEEGSKKFVKDRASGLRYGYYATEEQDGDSDATIRKK